MKRYRKVLWAAAAATLVLTTLVVAAGAQGLKRNPQIRKQAAGRAMFRAAPLFRGLDLTDQQKDQVKDIFANHKAEIQASVKEQARSRMILGKALADGASDQVLKAAFDNVSKAGWDAVQLRSRMLAEFKQVLTPEQLARLQERLQKVDGRIQNLLNRIAKYTRHRSRSPTLLWARFGGATAPALFSCQHLIDSA